MLRRFGNTASSSLIRGLRTGKLAQRGPLLASKRFQSKLSAEPSEVFTKLSDSNDPKRNRFFQYTWGSWLKDDSKERAKRETKFSIEGVGKLFQDILSERSNSNNVDKNGKFILKSPLEKNGVKMLNNNLGNELFSDSKDFSIKSIASIHEGKHHRVYKVTLSSDKDFILRIPYKLESDYFISQKIKSEVATLDFLNVKLNLDVPRVIAYGDSKQNPLESPFILMEYIEGDLLMKKWDPLTNSENSEEKLKEVIQPISDFQDKLLSVTFNRFGSLYFKEDVDASDSLVAAYDGEEDPLLKNRWKIGPSVEKVFGKNKNKLDAKQVKKYSGPWDSDKPLDIITATADIELENLRSRLSLAESDSSEKVENIDQLKKQIQTFENFKAMSQKLLDPKSKSIMNVSELFKPTLFAPDLDPLNVIMSGDKKFFIDFEYTTIKPFILTSYPAFVAYQGAKIYNLEEDIPGYSEMDDVEKQQYQFMYYKTRNERIWELELNSKRHDLIAVASPHIKVLKAPYLEALENKTDKDHLYVEASIIQLQAMWDAYVANELCNSDTPEFPVSYTAEYLDQHQSDIEEHQLEIVSTPFAATGGWIPQDMFDRLKAQNIIVETEDGNHKIEAEKALENNDA